MGHHNNEDIAWLKELSEWTPYVYENYRPVARESYAYLDWIIKHYDTLQDQDDIVFCQGHPFDHWPNFIEDVKSGAICLGWRESCDNIGMPRGDFMPLWSYSEVLGLPRQDSYIFIPGTQFRVTGKQIKSRPLPFYIALFNLCQLEYPYPARMGYVMERLYPIIFDIDLS